MQERILLFIPMYNCEKQIVRVFNQLTPDICQYLSEVIVVNNRSTDNGERMVLEHLRQNKITIPVKVLRNRQNYGLGGSHKVAFRYAINHGFDYVIVMHGDDQGRLADFIPLLKKHHYKEYDCCLGARFMRGSRLQGYSKVRILGNYGFNLLFSAIARKRIYDLGSGLNLYKVETLKSGYFMKYPDTLYFNDCMILASCYYGHKILFCPISWREEDQISNNRIFNFACSLLKMLGNYICRRKTFMESDMRAEQIEEYKADIIYCEEAER